MQTEQNVYSLKTAMSPTSFMFVSTNVRNNVCVLIGLSLWTTISLCPALTPRMGHFHLREHLVPRQHKNAAALSVNSSLPLLSGPSFWKQWIFSSSDPSMGSEIAHTLKLFLITSLGRLSQAANILSTQLRLEGALCDPLE